MLRHPLPNRKKPDGEKSSPSHAISVRHFRLRLERVFFLFSRHFPACISTVLMTSKAHKGANDGKGVSVTLTLSLKPYVLDIHPIIRLHLVLEVPDCRKLLKFHKAEPSSSQCWINILYWAGGYVLCFAGGTGAGSLLVLPATLQP